MMDEGRNLKVPLYYDGTPRPYLEANVTIPADYAPIRYVANFFPLRYEANCFFH